MIPSKEPFFFTKERSPQRLPTDLLQDFPRVFPPLISPFPHIPRLERDNFSNSLFPFRGFFLPRRTFLTPCRREAPSAEVAFLSRPWLLPRVRRSPRVDRRLRFYTSPGPSESPAPFLHPQDIPRQSSFAVFCTRFFLWTLSLPPLGKGNDPFLSYAVATSTQLAFSRGTLLGENGPSIDGPWTDQRMLFFSEQTPPLVPPPLDEEEDFPFWPSYLFGVHPPGAVPMSLLIPLLLSQR